MSDTTPKNAAALEFLLQRRSRPYKTLEGPIPSKDELQEILTAAARTPDHGKLEPFRFVVYSSSAMTRLSEAVVQRGHDIQKSTEDKINVQHFNTKLTLLVNYVYVCRINKQICWI